MISVEDFLDRHPVVIKREDDDSVSQQPNRLGERTNEPERHAQDTALSASASTPETDSVDEQSKVWADSTSETGALGGSASSMSLADIQAAVDSVGNSCSSSSDAHSGKGSQSHTKKRKGNTSHTHAVPVVSAYTSGFGGSLDNDERDAQRKKYRRHGRGHNAYRSRYRIGKPVRRVPDDPADVDACREAALTLLDSAARSSGALVKRLVDKGYDSAVSQQVVDRLVDVHLIDDEDYARSVIRSCASRMLGSRGALMELKRKGVEDHLASQVVYEAREQGVFEDSVWQLGRKIAAKTEGMDRQVRRRRFWSAGGRKGHDPEALRRVSHELFDNVSE